MKTSNVKAMSFGFNAVNAGQRNVNVEPQVIAASTEGGFRLTPAASRALGIGHGDYAFFINNIDGIDNAIRNRSEVVVKFCEENGLDVDSTEAAIALHKEFDTWLIAKGIEEFDAKGNARTITERLTKNDKMHYVTEHFEDMLDKLSQSENEDAKAAVFREGITEEEQKALLMEFVVPRETAKIKGSKAANAQGITGAGTSVNFTDTNVWKQLKVDLGDDAIKFNRVFDLDIDNVQEVQVDNGYKVVTVKAFMLGDFTDKEPARVGKSEE